MEYDHQYAESKDITIFRNCGFQVSFQFKDTNKYPQSITGYEFALQIAPIANITTPEAGQFGIPVLINTTPYVYEPGLITFQGSPSDSASLEVGQPYHYVAMSQAPSQYPLVFRHGRVKVKDAPPFPSNAPDSP